MSLTSSLINKAFVPINTLYGKRQKATLFDQIDAPPCVLFQFAHHMRNHQQRNSGSLIIFHQYVHIAFSRFLTASKRPKQPCFSDGLRLEIIGYLLCHYLCTHFLLFYIDAAKVQKKCEPLQKIRIF